MELHTEIKYLKGVGPQLASKMNKLGIYTLSDLFYFFPRRYEDRRKINNSNDIPEMLGENILLKGSVISVDLNRPRPRFYVLKAIFRTAEGQLFRAVWFNQKYLQDVLLPDRKFLISGKVNFNKYSGQYEIYVEDYDPAEENSDRIVPFYSLTEGLYQKKMRALVEYAINNYLIKLNEFYPPEFLMAEKLFPLKESIKELHFPVDRQKWRAAHQRVVYDEFFFIQLAMALRYFRIKKDVPGIVFERDGLLLQKYLKQLPYQLTGAQKRVTEEILTDMSTNKPMNRMVQGDVGSGKTDVAIITLLTAVQSGYQAAIMVPTEVLAEQHYLKIKERVASLGVSVELLLGRQRATEKQKIYEKLKKNQCHIVVGTHALIQEQVLFARLGLAIIDEQHRFGVLQRQLLRDKGEENIDLLVMTATPIPRTLSLALYGDLDKSVIDEMPPGRQQIKTYHINPSEIKKVYEFCRRELVAGGQVYIVYPLVEESEKIDLKAAVESYEKIKEHVFTEYNVGLLHGRMKGIEKEAVISKFRKKELQVLVSTTVIEVGVDVPAATVMVIEHAERFGLSQLHQLRGRVGRGLRSSYCFLVAKLSSAESKQRIKALVETNDGFEIAEADLALRGPGDFIGVRQSGLPELATADLVKDEAILKKSRTAAFALAEKDLHLRTEKNYLLKKELLKRKKGLVDYIFLD